MDFLNANANIPLLGRRPTLQKLTSEKRALPTSDLAKLRRVRVNPKTEKEKGGNNI
jgi:hypothetical protein